MLMPIKIAMTMATLYALVVVAGYILQRRLIYHPDTRQVSPAEAGLQNVAALRIPAPDGESVVAWYGKARPGKPTLLYFHGNGGTLDIRAPRIERFMGEGWGVLMMTYRGYGGSTGEPSEANNVADAVRTFDTLVASGVPADHIVLYGESLGTGVAAEVATKRPAAGLILDAPFTSVADIGARAFWYLPVRLLLSDRYDTRSIIGRIHMPLLILHGALDGTVPVDMGRTLARLANEPKTFVEFPKGGHSNLYVDGNNALAAVRTFMASLAIE